MISQYNDILLADAQQLSACNALHDAASRFCRWLLQSADRIGSDNLPLTQELLARMVGVRRTTITPVAQVLKEKGIIKYRRGEIAIADRKRLEEHACECYEVMNERKLAFTPDVER
ncbi:MAG: helix-turn-helix domain-containing protein [Xanthobacteraceae bacterium]